MGKFNQREELEYVKNYDFWDDRPPQVVAPPASSDGKKKKKHRRKRGKNLPPDYYEHAYAYMPENVTASYRDGDRAYEQIYDSIKHQMQYKLRKELTPEEEMRLSREVRSIMDQESNEFMWDVGSIAMFDDPSFMILMNPYRRPYKKRWRTHNPRFKAALWIFLLIDVICLIVVIVLLVELLG